MKFCTDTLSHRAPRVILVGALALTLAACAAGPAKRSARSAPASSSAPGSLIAQTPEEAQAKGDPDARFYDALRLMKARQFPEAQAAFLALSRDYPQFSGPFTDLGILYAQNRQRELAVESFTRAVLANPNNEVAHNWLGTLYRERGDFPRAEQSYRRAIAARPGYPQAHLNLGILYDVALHRPRDALLSYREYLRLTATDNLVVDAWIREIESRLPAPATTLAEAPR